MRFFGIFIIFSSWAVVSQGASIGVMLDNNKGVKELTQEKRTEAFDVLSKSLVDHPNEPALSYNLGLLFESTEDKEKASQSYLSAAKNAAAEPDLKFNALFNAARILGEQKKRDEALRLYQEALEIHPDSVEVKTNIELLMSNSGGGGEGKDQQDQKDKKEGDDQKEQENKPDDKKDQEKKTEPQQKPKPKPFESKELSQQDVKKILEELKRQEEGVRAKFNEKYRKETPVEKDW